TQPFNVRKSMLNVRTARTRKEKIMSPTAWDFQKQLIAILNGARQSGNPYVDVESGNLHQQAGGYANANHKMPVCCEVIRRMMRVGDSVLRETTSGQDATLTVRYTV